MSTSKGYTPPPGYGNVIKPTPKPPQPPSGFQLEPNTFGFVGAPAATGGGSSAGSGSGGGGGFGLAGDPGVLLSQNQLTTGNAQIDAALKSLRERAIIGFGDPNLTGVGFDLDPATKAQTQANYDSGNATLARLAHTNDLSKQAIINSLAAHGILQSGDLGYKEGEQGRAYGNQIYDARQQLIDYLTKGAQDALDRKNALQSAVNNAYLNAYSNGGLGGSGGSGGGGSGSAGGIVAPGGWGAAGSTYGQDAIGSAAWAMAQQRGWSNPSGSNELEVMQNGQVFSDGGGDYVFVKFGTPQGNSTEKVYLGQPAASGSGGGGGGGGAAASSDPQAGVNGLGAWNINDYFKSLGY